MQHRARAAGLRSAPICALTAPSMPPAARVRPNTTPASKPAPPKAATCNSSRRPSACKHSQTSQGLSFPAKGCAEQCWPWHHADSHARMPACVLGMLEEVEVAGVAGVSEVASSPCCKTHGMALALLVAAAAPAAAMMTQLVSSWRVLHWLTFQEPAC